MGLAISEWVCQPPPQYCDSPNSAPFSPRLPEFTRYNLISVIFIEGSPNDHPVYEYISRKNPCPTLASDKLCRGNSTQTIVKAKGYGKVKRRVLRVLRYAQV